MIMVKNIYFCIAKTKVDNPNDPYWIILLETDHLEELFGILHTMVGNNVNLDVYQLAERLGRTIEVSNILAKYPQWDRGLHCLKLPALTQTGGKGEITSKSDHIKPGSWKGDVVPQNITLQTCWRCVQ